MPVQSQQLADKPPAKTPKVAAIAQDTAPDTHVEKLVDEERSTDRATNRHNDLLSDRRPVL